MKEEKIEEKVMSIEDYKELSRKMKEIEKALKDNPEEYKKLKEIKKSESKVRPEKPEEYKSLISKFQIFVKSNILEIEKLFISSITSEKPEGQKWIIFNLGEKEKFGLGIINNNIKVKK